MSTQPRAVNVNFWTNITTVYLQTQTQNFNPLSIGDQYSCMCVVSVNGVDVLYCSVLLFSLWFIFSRCCLSCLFHLFCRCLYLLWHKAFWVICHEMCLIHKLNIIWHMGRFCSLRSPGMNHVMQRSRPSTCHRWIGNTEATKGPKHLNVWFKKSLFKTGQTWYADCSVGNVTTGLMLKPTHQQHMFRKTAKLSNPHCKNETQCDLHRNNIKIQTVLCLSVFLWAISFLLFPHKLSNETTQ